MAWQKTEETEERKDGFERPLYDKDKQVDQITRKDLPDKPIYEHCSRCGAVWMGWEGVAGADGIRRATYDGGLFVLVTDGHQVLYRCTCIAAERNYRLFPEVPERVYLWWIEQSRPERIIDPRVTDEESKR